MAYVQINARGIAGRVVNGNSISLETYDHAFTAGAAVFYGAHGDPFARQKEAARQAAKAEEDARKHRRELLRSAAPAQARAVWQCD